MRDHITKGLRAILITVAVCLSICGTALAQEEITATIVGQVTDSTGAVLPGASVVVVNKDTNAERRVQANTEGNYTVTQLLPGSYTVTVEQANFKKHVANITLNAKDRRPLNIVLEAGSVNETVTVTDEPPQIQDSPTGQTLISGTQVVELPLNNRNFIKLTELVPGVSSDLADESTFGLTSLASISINGMRRNAVNYLVDGVSATDVGSNITLLATPTVDSIQEFKVLTSLYTAEIGRSGGGAVTIVTRGGGNNFHGTLYEFVRNDYFNANTFFNNRLGTNPVTGKPRANVPKLRYNNFGGSFSGPVVLPVSDANGHDPWRILRNKTFFFFSQETRRVIRASTDASALVPTALERNGNFSATPGALLCTNAAGTTAGTCTGANTVPLMLTDTNGQSVQARQNMVFRPSDNRPYAGNIVPIGDIDPRSLALLSAYPLPNSPTSANGFTFSPLNINNTRQEVIRIDHIFNQNHRIFGRYTHDLSQTEESGGLFTGILLPGIATTETRVPGHVFAVSLASIFTPSIVNEATYNYSGNLIGSNLIGRARRSDYPGTENIAEFYPENKANVIPTIAGARFSTLAGLQGFQIKYDNHVFRDVLTMTRGNHTYKFGGEISFERKRENAGNVSQGSFGFSALQTQGRLLNNAQITGTGDAFASFLLGRANTYSEAEFDITVDLRFGRREFFAQDTWRIRPNFTFDYGVRYQYQPGIKDGNNVLASFDPALYNRSRVVCSTAACTSFNPNGTDPLNGIGVAGRTSRFGRSIAPADKNNISPRIGFAWDPFKSGKTVIRGGYGFYYDQPLVGVFEQASFTTPPFTQTASFTSVVGGSTVTYSQPNAGTPPGTIPVRSLIAISPDFQSPETQQWSLGIQREIFKNAVVDVSYVGTRGTHLIRRRNINFQTPAAIVAVGTALAGTVRPFLGWGAITYVETSASSKYHGLLSSFNYRFGRGLSLTASYTFSRNITDSTNDRDIVDDPQNPYNTQPEFAVARTSRPHIFSASYVYPLPFFLKSENWFARNVLGGWQISGITSLESGAPVARITISDTLSGQRGLYPNVISDPNGGLAGTIDPVTGLPFIYNPLAFAPAPNGTFGNAPRSFARLPGRNQTNLALSKQFYFNRDKGRYLQVRAESTNIFNHTQFTAIGTTYSTTGNVLTANLVGRPSSTRFPREFQFGLKLYF